MSVGQDNELWRLDWSIRSQLAEHDARLGDAYTLGKHLGFSDERAHVFMLVSEDSTEWGPARDVADAERFPKWHEDVDSLLRTLGYPVHVTWSNDENLWLRLAKGRALLNGVTDWLAARKKRPQQVIGEDWVFSVIVKRRGGAPKGYTTVVGPVPLARGNVETFERDFRRIAFADTIVPPSKH